MSIPVSFSCLFICFFFFFIFYKFNVDELHNLDQHLLSIIQIQVFCKRVFNLLSVLVCFCLFVAMLSFWGSFFLPVSFTDCFGVNLV